MNTAEGLELELVKQRIAPLCAFSLGREQIEQLEPSFQPLFLEKQNARVADLVRLAFENKEPLSLYRQLQALEGEVVQEPVSTPKRHWPLLADGILLLVTILCVAVWKIM